MPQLAALLLLLLLLLAAGWQQCFADETVICKSLTIRQGSYQQHMNASRLLEWLRGAVGGCQYVNGDVSILDIGVDTNGNAIGGSATRDLPSDFLDPIEEITGRLLIKRVNMRVLTFKNLRTIRGYNPKSEGHFYSLQLLQLKYSLDLQLPSLGAISGHNAALIGHFDLRPYCRLVYSVSWSDLFQSGSQRLVDQVVRLTDASKGGADIDISDYSAVQTACSTVEKCNNRCPEDSDKKLCWSGTSISGCQRRSRCNSGISCKSGTCYTDRRTRREHCCAESCLGGCTDGSSADCWSCRDVSLNGTCRSECPNNYGFDPGQNVAIKKGRMLRVGHICVNKCPKQFVKDNIGIYCIGKCPIGQVPVDGTCQPCALSQQGKCTTCELKSPHMDSKVVRQVEKEGCSVWKLTPQGLQLTGALEDRTRKALLSASIMYGTLKIMKIDAENLEFLRNLHYVTGSIQITLSSLQYFGLASLRYTERLALYKLQGLCPAWYPDNWLRNNSKIRVDVIDKKMKFAPNSSACASARCDAECDPRGCWGPGPSLCISCRHHRVAGRCVASCQEADSFAFNDSAGVESCRPCHPLCKSGCSGPEPRHCAQCKFFSLNGECVRQCVGDLEADDEGKCRPVTSAKLLGAGLAAACLSLLLLAALIASFLHFRRRIHKYELVDLDEALCDPADPSDMTQLLLVHDADIVKQREIGSGAFGTVYKGLLRCTTQNSTQQLPVAIKVLHGANANLGQELLQEATVLARVKHPHCIRLVALCMTQQVQLITALMPRGCLLDFLHAKKNKLSAERMLKWSLQVAEGMEYLHSLGIVHRDLAARNVLLESADVVKITDFGLAKLLDCHDQLAVGFNEKLPVKWLGVEYFSSGQFSQQSDVWSYGVLLWEICTFGESPYASSGAQSALEIGALLRNGVRLPQPEVCSVDFYNTMLSCWLPHPESRPNFKELKHTMQEFLDKPKRYIAKGLATSNSAQLQLQLQQRLLHQHRHPDAGDQLHIYTADPTARIINNDASNHYVADLPVAGDLVQNDGYLEPNPIDKTL